MRILIFDRKDELDITLKGKKIRAPTNSLKGLRKKSTRENQYDRRQRVVTKCSYKTLKSETGRRKSRLHAEYISREGVGHDGKAPELYGNITKDQLLDFHPLEEHQFRLMVSPEYWPAHTGLGLQKFTEAYMQHLNLETGYKLQYVAASHYNTDQPHSHIIIKGVDAYGRPVRFTREQICHRFREIARNDLTTCLGYRNPQAIEALRADHPNALRYIKTDQKIHKILKNESELTLKQINSYPPGQAEKIHKRCVFLAKQKIITRTRNSFIFSPDWRDILAKCGQINDYQYSLKSLRFNHKTRSNIYNSARDGAISGHISYVGVYDDQETQSFILVESFNGQNYFAKTSPEDSFKTGDIVTRKIDGFHPAGPKILEKYRDHKILKGHSKKKGIGHGL